MVLAVTKISGCAAGMRSFDVLLDAYCVRELVLGTVCPKKSCLLNPPDGNVEQSSTVCPKPKETKKTAAEEPK